MSPSVHSCIALMSHCCVTWPQTVPSLSPPVMAPPSTVTPVANNPLKYHLPAHCQLFLISLGVYSVIHHALIWDSHGSRHHAPSGSHTLYVHEQCKSPPWMWADPVYNSSGVDKELQGETGTSRVREQPLRWWTRAGRDTGRTCSCWHITCNSPSQEWIKKWKEI